MAKRIEQSCIALSTAAKMLQKMREAQKKGTNQRPFAHKFQVGDMDLVKKCNKDKLELKYVPGYRIIKLPTPWSAVFENQLTGKPRHCNVTDVKMKHSAEDWELKAGNIGHAAGFVNHPDNLPYISLVPTQLPISKQDESDHNIINSGKLQKPQISLTYNKPRNKLRCLSTYT